MKNDPAFPLEGYITPISDGPDGFKSKGSSGLTKREYIAVLTLQGILAGRIGALDSKAGKWCVDTSIYLTDALLTALEEPK